MVSPFKFKKEKYNRVKIEVDGIKFDSKREAKRYQSLQLLLKSGIIKGLRLQVRFRFNLEVTGEETEFKFPISGTKRKRSYIADFVYLDCQKKAWIVEDCKGFKNPEYKYKKKLMKDVFGVDILES